MREGGVNTHCWLCEEDLFWEFGVFISPLEGTCSIFYGAQSKC